MSGGRVSRNEEKVTHIQDHRMHGTSEMRVRDEHFQGEPIVSTRYEEIKRSKKTEALGHRGNPAVSRDIPQPTQEELDGIEKDIGLLTPIIEEAQKLTQNTKRQQAYVRKIGDKTVISYALAYFRSNFKDTKKKEGVC